MSEIIFFLSYSEICKKDTGSSPNLNKTNQDPWEWNQKKCMHDRHLSGGCKAWLFIIIALSDVSMIVKMTSGSWH